MKMLKNSNMENNNDAGEIAEKIISKIKNERKVNTITMLVSDYPASTKKLIELTIKELSSPSTEGAANKEVKSAEEFLKEKKWQESHLYGSSMSFGTLILLIEEFASQFTSKPDETKAAEQLSEEKVLEIEKMIAELHFRIFDRARYILEERDYEWVKIMSAAAADKFIKICALSPILQPSIQQVSKNILEKIDFAIGMWKDNSNEMDGLHTLKTLREEIVNLFFSQPEGAKEEAKWISVSERLPEMGQPCNFVVASDIKHYNGRVFGGTYTGNKSSKLSYNEFSIPGIAFCASHWMPLPAPPKS